jgi:acyl-CoA dehydrogenase
VTDEERHHSVDDGEKSASVGTSGVADRAVITLASQLPPASPRAAATRVERHLSPVRGSAGRAILPGMGLVDYPDATLGADLYALDPEFGRSLRRRGPAFAARYAGRLAEFGRWVGDAVEAQARYTDRYARPRLESHDGSGAAVGRVVTNSDYRACHAEAYRRGMVGAAYGDDPAPHLLPFAMGYLLSQADIALHCPVTLTGAVARVLALVAPPALRARFLPELVRTDGHALTGGTWATELHGGSDVGATTTMAAPDGGFWLLSGLKWFTSNAGCDLALATARPAGAPAGADGLGCYLVPTRPPDAIPGRVTVRRLKEKIGTNGLATGETMLDRAPSFLVAPPPDGLKAMLMALDYSRVHNAFAAAGVQRRAFLEAAVWATHRRAFGAPLRERPMVRDTLLDLAAETEAGLALALESGLAFDASDPGHGGAARRRMTTAIAKHWTAAAAVRAAAAAVEMVGGNGYTEEWPTARLYRDAPALAVWEGPSNIQALELLRAATGRLAGDAVFLDRVDGILGAAPSALSETIALIAPALAACRGAFAHLRRMPDDGPRLARRLLDLAADVLAAALSVEAAATDLAAGDGRKALIARRFAATRFGSRSALPMTPDPLHDAFDAAIGYGRIAP